MVVLSVAIGTKKGKLLLSRHFTDISRTLVEDCVKSLPRLIKSDQEHTYVEHNGLRLNYLPMDELYIISINDKNSNILEDIEIVRTLQNVLTQVLVTGIEERDVCDNAIDLILAIDDVISLGVRNICSESMILAALEMDSSNEKMMNAMRDNQQAEAKKKADKFLRDMRKKKTVGGGSEAYGSSEGGTGMGSIGGFGSGVDNSSNADVLEPYNSIQESQEEEPKKKSRISTKKGLTLGAKKKKQKAKAAKEKQKALKASLKKDDEDDVPFNPLDTAVDFVHKERISCDVDKDGKLVSFQVKGSVNFVINDPKKQRIAIKIDKGKSKEKIKLKVPPSFNKEMWNADSVIMTKNKELKLNTRTKIPAIKYNFSKTKGAFCPFTLSFWLTDGTLSAELEWNCDQSWISSLKNVKIIIPCTEGEPDLEDTENSDFAYEGEQGVWTIPELSEDVEDASISLVFEDTVGEDDLLPWNVTFDIEKPFAPLVIEGCIDVETDEYLKFEVETDAETENFVITN